MEASAKFAAEVLGSADVATSLQGCVALRLNGADLTDALREKYGLKGDMPQAVLIDLTGKVVSRAGASTQAPTLAKMLDAAKAHVAEQVAARDAEKDGDG